MLDSSTTQVVAHFLFRCPHNEFSCVVALEPKDGQRNVPIKYMYYVCMTTLLLTQSVTVNHPTQPQQKLKQPALHSPSFKHLEAVKCLLFRACVFSRGGAFWCFWHCLHFCCSWCFCGVKSIWRKWFWCQCRLVPRVFAVKTCKKVWFEV